MNGVNCAFENIGMTTSINFWIEQTNQQSTTLSIMQNFSKRRSVTRTSSVARRVALTRQILRRPTMEAKKTAALRMKLRLWTRRRAQSM